MRRSVHGQGSITAATVFVALMIAAFSADSAMAAVYIHGLRLSGNSATTIHYDSAAGSTYGAYLSLLGQVNGWGIDTYVKLSGSGAGPCDTLSGYGVMKAPCLDRWNLRAGRGPVFLQLGDVSFPAVVSCDSPVYGIRGAVGSVGGDLGQSVSATATGFCGMGSYGLSAGVEPSATWGGILDLGLGRGRGLGASLRYMNTTGESGDLDIGVVHAWLGAGRHGLNSEIALSHGRDDGVCGWSILGVGEAPVGGGQLRGSVRRTSAQFQYPGAPAGEGSGVMEFVGEWTGGFHSADSGGVDTDLGVTCSAKLDNIDGSSASATCWRHVEGFLRARFPYSPVVRLKYLMDVESLLNTSAPSRDSAVRTVRALSVDAAVPMRVAGLDVGVLVCAGRTATENAADERSGILDELALRGSAAIGSTSVVMQASVGHWTSINVSGANEASPDSPAAVAALKPQASHPPQWKVGLSLDRPLGVQGLTGALAFTAGSMPGWRSRVGGAADPGVGMLDAAASIQYEALNRFRVRAKYVRAWRFHGAILSEPACSSSRAECELTYRF